MKVCILSTYYPAKCGIAEYASELAQSLQSRGVEVHVIAVDQGIEKLTYPNIVSFVIRRDEIKDYLEAAEHINDMDIDVLIIQHEYGIFGGECGSYLIDLMKRVRVPIITTLHTVVPPPNDYMRSITERILRLSALITIMSRSSLRILRKYYNAYEGDKIYIVPHGVKTIYVGRRDEIRKELGINNNFVMLTIGLLGPNKGVKFAISALPKIAKHVDNVLYLVVGETHPKLRMMRGDIHREKLMKLSYKLNVEERVIFINKFLTKEDYVKYIIASDVVVLPYIDEMQVSSGTLSYALSYGKAIVATPFIYAREMLSNGRGILCKFKDPNSIAEAIIKLAKNPKLKAQIEYNALKYGLRLRWDVVSDQLLKLLANLTLENEYVGEGSYVTPTYAKVS